MSQKKQWNRNDTLDKYTWRLYGDVSSSYFLPNIIIISINRRGHQPSLSLISNFHISPSNTISSEGSLHPLTLKCGRRCAVTLYGKWNFKRTSKDTQTTWKHRRQTISWMTIGELTSIRMLSTGSLSGRNGLLMVGNTFRASPDNLISIYFDFEKFSKWLILGQNARDFRR